MFRRVNFISAARRYACFAGTALALLSTGAAQAYTETELAAGAADLAKYLNDTSPERTGPFETRRGASLEGKTLNVFFALDRDALLRSPQQIYASDRDYLCASKALRFFFDAGYKVDNRISSSAGKLLLVTTIAAKDCASVAITEK